MTKILIRNNDIQGTTRIVVQLERNGEDEYVAAILGPGEQVETAVDGTKQGIRVREVPHAPDTLPPPGVPV